jgi:uncharacterized protein (TIGR03086 family)
MLTLLDRCLDYADRVIAGIPDDRRTAPTPCADYDVEHLTAHLVKGTQWTADLPGGGTTDPLADPEPDLRGVALAEAFRAAAADTRAKWTGADLGRTFVMPFAEITGEGLIQYLIVELLGHGWDLAVATGQPADAGDDLAEAGLRVARDLGEVLRSPGMMGPMVSVPAGAPAMDRFAAYLGRNPG